MSCTYCGAELRPDMRFCTACGQAVGAASAPTGLPLASSKAGFPAPVAEPWQAPNDPHGMYLGVTRLGPAARRAGRPSFMVAATHLTEGERVETLVQGRVMGVPGAALLTAVRVLAVNEAEWKPLVLSIPIVADLTIQGWEDERTATLLVQTPQAATTIDLIRDRLLAHEFAHRLRSLVAGSARTPPPVPPPPGGRATEDGAASEAQVSEDENQIDDDDEGPGELMEF